jgi:hypothetical protein
VVLGMGKKWNGFQDKDAVIDYCKQMENVEGNKNGL